MFRLGARTFGLVELDDLVAARRLQCTLGEFAAFSIGWTMLLEYVVGAATVAVSFSGYLDAFLHSAFGVTADRRFTLSPFTFDSATTSIRASGAFLDLPAASLLLGLTALLVTGIRSSARFNSLSVSLKLVVILLFLLAGVPHLNPSNWSPFIPASEGPGKFGPLGVLRGASIVFFAYIGFDSISTVAQESITPQRSLPLSILLSLSISTLLYILVCLVLTGLVPYKELAGSHPIALGIRATGITWLEPVVDFGALAGLASTALASLLAVSRIASVIAADGLLPASLSKLHPKFGTPYLPTVLAGTLAAGIAASVPISALALVTSAGTLTAFLFVCIAVPLLRYYEPEAPRPFRVPGGPVIPVLGGLSALLLLVLGGWLTVFRLLGWLIPGWIYYFLVPFRRPDIPPDVLKNEDGGDMEMLVARRSVHSEDGVRDSIDSDTASTTAVELGVVRVSSRSGTREEER